VQAARRGDRGAFAGLISDSYPLLLRVCRRALGDRELARDAAQQTVVVAMLALDRLREDSRFESWLVGIALNVCRQTLRARAGDRFSPVPPDALAAAGSAVQTTDPLAEVNAHDASARVRAAIAMLPPGQREAVSLFYVAGLTCAEIAEELGTQPGAVKTRLHKARRSLRPALSDLWKEYYEMPTQTSEFVPMTITDLRRNPAAESSLDKHVLTLREHGGDRTLQIWIGQAEATALAIVLEGIELPRPGAYQFTAALLRAVGGKLREVRIVELADFTFYAQAILGDGTPVDARPSDALTLAALTRAPIKVAVGVLDQTADDEREDLSDEDDASVIANETKRRLENEMRQLREISNPD
jgi:RNA polymerase sigma factor (sigma-70 family)